jgi:hypothetical protein
VSITQALPADGDPPNASTYAQAYKVAADFIDWGMKPQAKSGDYTAPGHIIAYRTAGGHKRFRVDHLGLPSGWLVSWIEDWARGVGLTQGGGPRDINGRMVDYDSAFALAAQLTVAGGNLNLMAAETTWNATAQAKAGFAGAALVLAGAALDDALSAGPWLLKAVFTSGTSIVGFADPSGAVMPNNRFLYLIPGDTLNDYGMIYRNGACRFDESLSFALQWTTKLEATNMGTKLATHQGFCTPNDFPNQYVGTAADYAVFYLGASGNWFAGTRGSAGTPTTTDTAVAPTTSVTRMRIEFYGATVADNTTRTVKFYINGALVATHTTNLPAATALASAHFSCVNYQGGAHALTLPVAVGPVAFAQNLFGSDV